MAIAIIYTILALLQLVLSVLYVVIMEKRRREIHKAYIEGRDEK